ncbi:MAG: pyruvate kinase, partial [Calditrichaceae bacterium]
PKIRVGKFANPPITLNPGDLFTITTDEDTIGNENIVSTSYKHLAKDVNHGDEILVNDGLIKLKVMEKTDQDIFCEVINGGSLYDRRGINLPGIKISEPSLTDKDKTDLKFGLDNGVDYVALSFVRDADSLREIKKIMGKYKVPVIAKLEKPEALNNLDEIIAEADGIMVARGDLGVEILSARVPVVQKEIIEKCIKIGKPVITATQMLDSMMTNPIPTRAETSDVANAIFDGSDEVMLSGETAFGKYPVESVKMMKSIICEAEKRASYYRLKPVDRYHSEDHEFANSICFAAYYAANEIDARYIVVFTRSGFTAEVMSALRPKVPILALTPSEITMRKLTLQWGVYPRILEKMMDFEADMGSLESFLKKDKWVEADDNIVVISGSSREAGGTNSLRLHAIGKQKNRKL